MKGLIVTADDFGLTDRVNLAVEIGCSDGILTTASFIVTGSGFESATSIVRKCPQLDVGLHLNLTEGHPITPFSSVSSLAGPTGFRYTHPLRLAVALVRGKVRAGDLEREIRAQLEKAMSAGVRLSHIDGHKHVHAIPAILKLISRIAPEYGIFAIRSVKETVPRLLSVAVRNFQSSPQVLMQYGFGKLLSAAWTAACAGNSTFPLRFPQNFYGVTQTGFLDFEAFEAIVNDLRDGFSELMCHPGYVDQHLRQTPTRLLHQRERELELLTSREVRDLVKRQGIQLMTFREVFGSLAEQRRPSVAPGVSPGF